MDNIVDLHQIKANKKRESETRKLDAQASYVIIEKSLKNLELNNLKELDSLKKNMKETMKKLIEIGKNG